MTERIDLSALRVGDKVTITFEVTENEGRHGVKLAHEGNLGVGVLFPFNTYHGTVERAPRPLEVGDRVFADGNTGTVIAIHGQQAWVKQGDVCWTYEFSDLTREAFHDARTALEAKDD